MQAISIQGLLGRVVSVLLELAAARAYLICYQSQYCSDLGDLWFLRPVLYLTRLM